MLELYLKNKRDEWILMDTSGDLSVPTTYQVSDYSKPDAIKNSFSKTVNLPSTATNNIFFGDIYRLDFINTNDRFNPNKTIDFYIANNGELIEKGYATLDTVTCTNGLKTYSLTLYGGLGAFFYGLAYNDNGEELSLADVHYGFITKNPYKEGVEEPINKELEKNQVLFNYNSDYVKTSWNVKKENDNKINKDNVFKTFMPIPCYTGYHEDFDNDKILFNQDVFNKDKNKLITPYTAENNKYSASYTDGWCLLEEGREVDQWEVRDIRSHYMPLGVNMKYIYDKILSSDLVGDFKIDDSAVNSKEKDMLSQMYMFNSPFDWKGITEARFEAGETANHYDTTEARSTEKIYEVPFDMSEHSLYTITDVQQYIKDTQEDVDLSINFKVNQEYFVCMENAQEYQLKWWNDDNMRQRLIDNINAAIPHYKSFVDLRYIYYNFTIIKFSSKISSTAWTNKYYVIGKNINDGGITDYDGFKERVRQYLISYCVSHFGIEPNTDYMFLDGEYGNIAYDASRPDIFPRGNYSYNLTQAFGVYNKDDVNITIPLNHNTQEIKVSCFIGHYRRAFQGKLFLADAEGLKFNKDLDENIYTNCGLTLYGMMSQSPIYNRTMQNGLPYEGDHAPNLGMDLTSNHLCVINQCVNLGAWSIFFGDSLDETHELTKQNILGNTMSPYKYLKSLGNLFNWKFALELDTIKIYSWDNFYYGDAVDITDKIDFSTVSITPTNIEYKDYIYNITKSEDTYPSYLYKKKYDEDFGKFNYTTDFNKNTEPYEMCEDNELQSLPMWKHRSPLFFTFNDTEAKEGGYNNRALMTVGVGVTLWDSTKDNKTTVDVVGAFGKNPSKFSNRDDGFSKLSLFDKDSKEIDAENCICFFSGFRDITDSITDSYGNNINAYYLTDNTSLMYELNEKPCHLMDGDKNKIISELPIFSNNNGQKLLTFKTCSVGEEPHGLTTLYDDFYKTWNNTLLNGNNKLIEVKFKMCEQPYKAMRRIYKINNTYFVLNKITDYELKKDKFVKCQFVSLDSPESL